MPSSSSSSSRNPSGQEGHGSASRSQAPPASPSAPPPPLLNNAIDNANANANANVDDDQEQHNRQLRMRVAQAYLDRVLEGDAQAKDKEEAAAAKKAREEEEDDDAVRASGLLVDELEQVKGELADSHSTNATLSAEAWASQNRILALEAEVRGANARLSDAEGRAEGGACEERQPRC